MLKVMIDIPRTVARKEGFDEFPKIVFGNGDKWIGEIGWPFGT